MEHNLKLHHKAKPHQYHHTVHQLLIKVKNHQLDLSDLKPNQLGGRHQSTIRQALFVLPLLHQDHSNIILVVDQMPQELLHHSSSTNSSNMAMVGLLLSNMVSLLLSIMVSLQLTTHMANNQRSNILNFLHHQEPQIINKLKILMVNSKHLNTHNSQQHLIKKKSPRKEDPGQIVS